ncbi:Aste57867_1915 [Aphanomyces stellatus]|uniref:Aste57867_1915 protein n=1 Tax=Aphanomyces stellatus TaxID=120398 RepID=A0A485KBX5_9STRA|nr:hypothetical protein As57867_001913 [Aphanomyces stellatus]VFT79120.1 Aste57867_1915 [Aphanomyces stellatus]
MRCLPLLALLLSVLRQVGAATSASITVRVSGTATQYTSQDIVTSFDGTVAFSVEFDKSNSTNSLVLVVYSQPSLQGNRSFVVESVDFGLVHVEPSLVVRSFQILDEPSVVQLVRSEASPNAVVLATQSTRWLNGNSPLAEYTAVTDSMASIPPTSFVRSIDLPRYMIVQAFRLPQFVSQCNIWTSAPVDHPFILSFRVWRLQDLPSLPPNDPVVTLNAPAPIVNFAGQIAQAGILVVRPSDQVASLVFLRGRFNVLFDSIDVPHGLMFIWYPDMNFGGSPTVVRGPSTLVGAMPWQTQMQSFRVVVDNGQIALPPPTSAVNVTCHTTNDKTLVHFAPNTTYSMLLPCFCTSLTIPPGLAVLSYDRPWLLGSFHVWDTSIVQPAVGSPVVLYQYPMRSLQVVPINAIPPTTNMDATRTGSTSKFFYKAPLFEPAVNTWEQPTGQSFWMTLSDIPAGYVATLYDDYNFQGRRAVVTQLDHSNVPANMTTFKSYSLLAETDQTTLPLFAGCYPVKSELNMTPIFLQPGEHISAFQYPWGGRIDQFTVPRGLALVSFAQEHFQGPSTIWTANSGLCDVSNTYSIQVRRATDLELPNSTTVSNVYSNGTMLPSTTNATTATWTIVLPSVGGVLVVASVVVFGLRRRRSQQQNGASSYVETKSSEDDTSINYDYSAIQWKELDMVRLATPVLPLTTRLASGSSGEIFLGTFQHQPVAIKTVRALSPTEIQSFIDEILLFDQVQSPYIVKLIGAAWTRPTNLQAIMEYMNLGDLRNYLVTTTPATFSWTDKMKSAWNVAQALFCLHSQDMMHRDLKSRNVLMDSEKGAKLADFGASKEVLYGDTLTMAVGTFLWMAPEMLLFKGYTNAVDIYSFGVLLSELNTHRLPYADLEIDGQSEEIIVRRVIHDGLRPSLSPDCPDWYRSLAMDCMAIDPDTRPSVTHVMYILKTHTK